MKKVLVIAVICFLIACGGDNRNELMTNLVNEKKVLQDSMSRVNIKVGQFVDRKSYDSSISLLGTITAVQKRIKQVDFSIDSLSKMK